MTRYTETKTACSFLTQYITSSNAIPKSQTVRDNGKPKLRNDSDESLTYNLDIRIELYLFYYAFGASDYTVSNHWMTENNK
jgi:hypothetical protein